MKTTHKPGDLLKMFREGGTKRKAAMKAAGIKHSGSFQGKSNTLGHGGRAAQLKARGVPGGVIGMLARRAGAAPGQANYHGKKKVAAPEKQNLGLALKKAMPMKRSKGATHIHVHFHGDIPQGTKQEHMEEDKHEFKRSKMKRKASTHGTKMVDPKTDGDELEHEEEGKKEFKRKGSKMDHKCKGAKCKHASHKEKGAKKKASMGLPKLGANQAFGAPGKVPVAMRNAPNPSWVKQKHTKKKVHQR